MANDPNAGKLADPSRLANIPKLVASYYTLEPDPDVKAQRVAFGTSGHRGTSLAAAFNENHILAITQAICDYRSQQGTSGPLFLGMDTHALSEPAFRTALEVLAANNVTVMVDSEGGYTPTPALSHAILTYNAGRTDDVADGIVIVGYWFEGCAACSLRQGCKCLDHAPLRLSFELCRSSGRGH
jgi:phosphoglucomutase